MKSPLLTLLPLALVTSLVACGPADDDLPVINTDDGDAASNGTTGDDGVDGCSDCDPGEFAAERKFCVEFLNELRARQDRPPLTRAADLETCATSAAREDARSGQPHGHFRQTSGCDFTAIAENEVPGWPLSRYDGVKGIVEAGAESMYAEGPGGGHYENIVGDYTRAGCGIHVTADDEVWVVHNFH